MKRRGVTEALTLTDVDYSVALARAAIDEDQLVLSNFSIANNDRPAISSKSNISYLRLSLASLQKGLSRNYMNGNMKL